MNAHYRKLYPRIWRDEKFRLLSNVEKLITVYVLTCQSNRIGLFSFSPGKACEDLGTLPPTFQEGFLNVCRTFGWEWDDGARMLAVRRRLSGGEVLRRLIEREARRVGFLVTEKRQV